MKNKSLSIIIPTYNEAENIDLLIRAIAASFKDTDINWELIFVDDHSGDATVKRISDWQDKYPIRIYEKKGKPGKGYSILEGAGYAAYDYIAMLDADLQFPPQLLPELLEQAQQQGFAVARRKKYQVGLLRKLGAKFNNLLVGNWLLNLKTDVQSGLKIFSRDVFEHLDRNLLSGWGADIPLIYTAYQLGYKEGHVDFDFKSRKFPRRNKKSKRIKSVLEIGKGALKTKFFTKPLRFLPWNSDSMLGSGLAHKRQKYITHTTLSHEVSALKTFLPWQMGFLILVGAGILTGVIINPLATAITLVSVLSAAYLADVVFNLFVILKSLHFPSEIFIDKEKIKKLKGDQLPVYTVLCPLYQEAKVLPQFIEAMRAIDWPQEKLEVILLLEEDDRETQKACESQTLPANFKVVTVPDSHPKTKPKACNYGLGIAKGEYIVIYDAEDQPDPQQLKKAFLAFQDSGEKVVCLQAKLNYYNPHNNLLTRLFTTEYSLWFDVILPGLQSIKTTIPLGGTSNHFKTSCLRELQGWDPFNVTEDCDLGARLFNAGYKTAIIDSTTLEEANSNLKNWFRQRSRWIKGYMQTYLVHMRRPLHLYKKQGLHALIFQLVVGGKIAFILINPLLWLVTISYFVLNRFVGPAIEAIYPAPVFYVAATSMVIGNFVYLYNYMIGCAKRGQWNLVKYVFLIPFYWMMISTAAAISLFQLFFKPHYWEKTIHGFHLEDEQSRLFTKIMRLKLPKVRAIRLARLADLAHSKTFGGGLLVASSLVINVFNYLYNAYLGRKADLSDFGIISLIGSLLYIAQVPIGALGGSITHKSAYLLGKYESSIKEFWQKTRKKSLNYALLVSVIWLLLSPLMKYYFHTPNVIPFLLFTPVWLVGTFAAIDRGFLGGNLKFSTLALIGVTEAVTKLTASIILMELGLHQFVYVAIPISMTVAFLFAWLSAGKVKTRPLASQLSNWDLAFPKKFFTTSILTALTGITYISLDLILAKHYLSPQDAGAYSFMSLAGKMVLFLGSLAGQFVVPLVSQNLGAGKVARRLFMRIFLIVAGVNLFAYTLFGIFGSITIPILWGDKAQAITVYLPYYALAMVGYSLSSLIITYHQLKGKYSFPVVGFLLGLLQVGGMMAFHDSIEHLVAVVSISSLISLVGILFMDCFYPSLVLVSRSVIDFFLLFHKLPVSPALSDGKLRILVFNWRDLRHKWAGGAEVYLQELAKRWVKMGHQVTIFCGSDGYSRRHELVDGVKIIRRGGFYLVYVWAYLYYLFRLKGNYDVILDSENGIPFFTPLYCKERVFLLIHHVHQEVFRKSLNPPLSWIAIFLERRLMPVVYRNTEVITVSPSSRADILANKLSSKEPQVIYNGVDLKAYRPGKKSPTPLVTYLGRLTSLKSLPILIRSANKIREAVPEVKFVIAGDGPHKQYLIELVKKLKLDGFVSFFGKITEEEKIRLYQKSWVFVNPSLIEGWGITTIEANACGTPVVASNVSGLRDAVHNPHSGVLVPYGNVDEFANSVIELLTNKPVLERMSKEAVTWAEKFDWEKSAQAAIEVISEK